MRRWVRLVAFGGCLVNWISLDDLSGVFLCCLLGDVHGDVDGVSANPLRRKDFIAHLSAIHAPGRIAMPAVGHVFRHSDPDAAVRHVLGRK